MARWERNDGKGFLSVGQQERYEKKGITYEYYRSGQSLQVGRGHGQTPERPSRANPAKPEHQAYIFKRDQLIDQIYEIKEAAYGNRPLWNAKWARKGISHHPKGKERSMASLKRVYKAIRNTDDFDLAVMELDDDDRDALYYH
jgi:hypothetical protein